VFVNRRCQEKGQKKRTIEKSAEAESRVFVNLEVSRFGTGKRTIEHGYKGAELSESKILSSIASKS